VSIEAEVLSLFKAAEEKFGAITALVNNAGILEQQSLFQNMSVERWQHIFGTNVTGSFICAREAIKRMAYKTVERAGL
jgi:NAD(P)-dependent dehydrogenase (short-subunit alcohol dehydrogenase family)